MAEQSSPEDECATVLPSSLVPLESVLYTEELNRRPSRPPDYATENRALAALVQALADSPRSILQTLADNILEVLHADSAGISLLTKDDGGKRFYWPAIAGVWKPHIGGGTPRDFGPCGDVLDRNAALMFRHFERRYTYFLPVTPPVEECLLVPFYVERKAVGTIWAIAHDNRRKFDAEDLRQLESMGRFASAAYQAVASLDALQQRDGSERRVWGEGRGVYNGTDEPVAIDGFVADITEHYRAEQATALLSAIVDSSDDAIISKGLDGIITSWNKSAERLFGYTASEAVGQPITMLIPSDRLDEEPKIIERLKRGERVDHFETIRMRKDGSRLDISLTISPVKDASGRIVGASKVARDITERRRIEQQRLEFNRELEKQVSERTAELHQANRALLQDMEKRARLEEQLRQSQKLESMGVLAAGVAHDLNNLLNIIQGYASVLGADATGDDIEESVNAIAETTKRGAVLVQQLLASARKTEIKMEFIDVKTLIEGLSNLIKGTFPKNIETRLDLAPMRSTIMADASQITQVLLNLCVNARDAMPNGGSLTLKTSIVDGEELHVDRGLRSEGYVSIEITDTGTGMDEDVQDRIFDPFFTTKEIGKGTGLGLAVVYGIVKSHNGFIQVESQPLHGTTFRLYFPAVSSAG